MSKRYFSLALILALFLFSFQLGVFPLIDLGESQFAESAREMIVSNKFLFPEFNYVDQYDKPILFYWLEVFSFKMFGLSEFTARLPSLIAGLGLVAIAFLLGSVQNIGLTSALMMLSCLGITTFSRVSTADICTSFFICATISFFYLGYCNRYKYKRRFAFKKRTSSVWFIWAFVCYGLGAICQGSIALIIPALVIIPFLWWQKDINSFISDTFREIFIGFMAFLAIALPWYLYAHFYGSGEFLSIFLEANSIFNNSDPKPWWLYFPILLIGVFPWSVFLLQSFFNPDVYNDPYKPNEGKTPQLLLTFCLWWTISSFLFFTIIPNKSIGYILPIVLPLVIIIAKWWSIKFRINKYTLSNFDALWGLLVLLTFTITGLFVGLSKIDSLFAENDQLNLFLPSIIITVIIGTCTCIAMTAIMKQPKISFTFVFISFFISYLIAINSIQIPIVNHYQKGLMNYAKNLKPDETLVTFKIERPSLMFYSKRPVPRANYEEFSNFLNSYDKVNFVSSLKNIKKFDNYYKETALSLKPEDELEASALPYRVNKVDQSYIYGSNKLIARPSGSEQGS